MQFHKYLYGHDFFLLDQPKKVPVPGDVQSLMEMLSIGPVNANHTKSWTDRNLAKSDIMCSMVGQMTNHIPMDDLVH